MWGESHSYVNQCLKTQVFLKVPAIKDQDHGAYPRKDNDTFANSSPCAAEAFGHAAE